MRLKDIFDFRLQICVKLPRFRQKALGKSSLHLLARCRLRQVPIEYIPVILLENQQERGEVRVCIVGSVRLLLKSPLISLELCALFRKLR